MKDSNSGKSSHILFTHLRATPVFASCSNSSNLLRDHGVDLVDDGIEGSPHFICHYLDSSCPRASAQGFQTDALGRHINTPSPPLSIESLLDPMLPFRLYQVLARPRGHLLPCLMPELGFQESRKGLINKHGTTESSCNTQVRSHAWQYFPMSNSKDKSLCNKLVLDYHHERLTLALNKFSDDHWGGVSHLVAD